VRIACDGIFFLFWLGVVGCAHCGASTGAGTVLGYRRGGRFQCARLKIGGACLAVCKKGCESLFQSSQTQPGWIAWGPSQLFAAAESPRSAFCIQSFSRPGFRIHHPCGQRGNVMDSFYHKFGLRYLSYNLGIHTRVESYTIWAFASLWRAAAHRQPNSSELFFQEIQKTQMTCETVFLLLFSLPLRTGQIIPGQSLKFLCSPISPFFLHVSRAKPPTGKNTAERVSDAATPPARESHDTVTGSSP